MSAANRRLSAGGRVQRGTSLRFSFNGRSFEGLAGDTLASALLANGVSLVARSWKYHRPRGILSAGVEEPNALVQLFDGARTVPNARMTEVELVAGLSAKSIHAKPSIEFDLRSVNGWFARFCQLASITRPSWPRRKPGTFLSTTSARPAAWVSRRVRLTLITMTSALPFAMC